MVLFVGFAELLSITIILLLWVGVLGGLLYLVRTVWRWIGTDRGGETD